MGFLPRKLILLNDDLSRKSVLSRLGSTGAVSGTVLKERHYDEIIVSHQDVFADALREAGLIGQDSELLFLGKQILAIDVLFAEVEIASATFRRFVLAEDKLFRSPEARREVLGQILDYSRALQGMDPDHFAELLPNDKGPWVDANEDLVWPALRDANFMLVICGDQIQRRQIDYLHYLKDHFDLLSAVDLALVSIAVFSNGTDHLLLPHVVGAMVKAERPITIKVMVTDTMGGPVAASVSVETVSSSRPEAGREKIEREELLAEIGKAGGDARKTAELLFECAETLGAEISLRAAAASVRVRNLTTGRPCTVCVVTRRATFYTGFVSRWEANAGVTAEVARDYDAALTKILGRSPRMARGDLAGSKAIPLAEIGQYRDEVFAAMGKVIAELRDSLPTSDITGLPNPPLQPTGGEPE